MQENSEGYDGGAMEGSVLQSPQPSWIGVEDTEEYKALLSRYNALKDAVVILEDGAAFQEGDFVKLGGRGGYIHLPAENNNFPHPMVYFDFNDSMNNAKGATILTRNGKPVIYQTDNAEIK